MAGYRKLGRATDQRMAILRNQVTALLENGSIKTTLQRAKEVRRIAEKLITLAVNECDNNVTVTKDIKNEKGQVVQIEVTNDSPSKLAARRRIMSKIYDVKPRREDNENRTAYRERLDGQNHPLVEKMFNEIGPHFKERKEETGTGGGYTRILKLGPRKGDGAEMVILELVN